MRPLDELKGLERGESQLTADMKSLPIESRGDSLKSPNSCNLIVSEL